MNNENVTVELYIHEDAMFAEGEEQVAVTLNVNGIITKTFDYALENAKILNLSSDLSNR